MIYEHAEYTVISVDLSHEDSGLVISRERMLNILNCVVICTAKTGVFKDLFAEAERPGFNPLCNADTYDI